GRDPLRSGERLSDRRPVHAHPPPGLREIFTSQRHAEAVLDRSIGRSPRPLLRTRPDTAPPEARHAPRVKPMLDPESSAAVGADEAATLARRGIPLSFLPVLTDGERAIAYGRFSERRLRRELGL